MDSENSHPVIEPLTRKEISSDVAACYAEEEDQSEDTEEELASRLSEESEDVMVARQVEWKVNRKEFEVETMITVSAALAVASGSSGFRALAMAVAALALSFL